VRGRALGLMARTALVVVCLSTGGAPWAWPGHAAAQGTPYDINPWVQLLPRLSGAPAPGWLTPGTRITYYAAAASRPHPRASGQGYTQVNVVWLDRAVAVLELRSYTITGPGGATSILGYAGAVEPPGAGGDYWLNPQVLDGVAAQSTPGARIVRTPYAINGKQFDATWFQTGGQTWVYDRASGVLLHSSAVAGRERDRDRDPSLLTQSTLVDVRRVAVPWSTGPVPAWVGQTRSLRYQGTYTLRVTGFPVPVAVTFTLRQRGVNWARYTQTIATPGAAGMPPSTTEYDRVFGPAQIGGLWIAPQAMGSLHPGQVLDSDRFSGVTTTVGPISRTPQGGQVVGITEAGAGHRIDYVYDRASGLLVAATLYDGLLNSVTQVHLVARQ
jgi:hypothetical protein